MSRKYRHAGNRPQRSVYAARGGRIHPEHVDGMVKLYMLDGLTQTEIAKLCGCPQQTVSKLVSRARRVQDGIGDEKDVMYMARAEVYAQALRLLEEKPGWPYRRIAQEAKLSEIVIREIARRNGLERRATL